MSYVNGTAIICVGSILPSLAIIAVTARFIIRKQQNQGFRADDWLILPALLITVGIGVVCLYGAAERNFGYPAINFSPTDASPQVILNLKLEMAVFTMQAVALGFAKLSITCFYRRIFLIGTKTKFDIFTKLLMAVIVLWSTAWVLAYIFGCGSKVYLQLGAYAPQHASCSSAVIKESVFVAVDLVVDVILFVTPIPLIAKLHMSKMRRFALIVIFCLGTLTIVVSIVRTAILSLIYEHKLNSLSTTDQDLEVSTFAFWTMIETGLAVIVACLPTFPILLQSDTLARHVRGFMSIISFSQRSSRRSRTSDVTSEKYPSHHNQDQASIDRATIRAKKEHYPEDAESQV